MVRTPISPFLETGGHVLLDGGLSTQLESQGHDLRHSLWTARLLAEDPDAIQRAHRAFLDAGADCVISSSYQATPRGLVESGFSHGQARELIRRSYVLARDACEEFHAARGAEVPGPRPIAAASIGPYGAYLADGSEYRGDYGLNVEQLVDFHRERFELLAEIAPLLAIETIPSLDEARALRSLLSEHPGTHAWVSFSCRDGEHIADGHRLQDAVALFDDLPNVVAVGVNCTDPVHVSSLIEQIRAGGGDKQIVVYPNSGERYCADEQAWTAGPHGERIEDLAASWFAQGARLIGGCCRITAKELARVGRSLGDAPGESE